MICKNCGEHANDSANFCMYCGNKIIKKMCSYCESIMPECAIYCSECGQKFPDNNPLFSANVSKTIDNEDEYGYENYDDYNENHECDEINTSNDYDECDECSDVEDYDNYDDAAEYDDTDDYDDADDYDDTDDYEDFFEDENQNTNEYGNNTIVPTLDNYKDLGIDSAFTVGYFPNFSLPSAYVKNNDPYAYIYGPEKKYTFEKCNLYDIYHYIIVSDGIFYTTRNEAIYLHKDGRKFSVKKENICSIFFDDTTLTIINIKTLNYGKAWDEYFSSTDETTFDYNYILNNLS